MPGLQADILSTATIGYVKMRANHTYLLIISISRVDTAGKSHIAFDSRNLQKLQVYT